MVEAHRQQGDIVIVVSLILLLCLAEGGGRSVCRLIGEMLLLVQLLLLWDGMPFGDCCMKKIGATFSNINSIAYHKLVFFLSCFRSTSVFVYYNFLFIFGTRKATEAWMCYLVHYVGRRGQGQEWVGEARRWFMARKFKCMNFQQPLIIKSETNKSL